MLAPLQTGLLGLHEPRRASDPSTSAQPLPSPASATSYSTSSMVASRRPSLPNTKHGSHFSMASAEASSSMHTLDAPRSSILLNPMRKRKANASEPSSSGIATADGPVLVVSRIPAVPSAKEKERMMREREREREEAARRREREAEDKVFGIPKKAFYFGLADFSWSTQVGLLGTIGAGGMTEFVPANLSDPNYSQRERRLANEAKREKRKSRERPRSSRGASSSSNHSERKEKEPEDEEPMDPEELAALNAIINTRRSMAAAQALASGQVKFTPRRAWSASQERESEAADVSSVRPKLGRGESQDSTSTSLHSEMASSSPGTSYLRGGMGLQPSRLAVMQGWEPKIRFAPLPLPDEPAGGEGDETGSSDEDGEREDGDEYEDVDGSDLESNDDDAWMSWRRRSGMKGKWYLMGLPSSAFKPQSYRTIKRARPSVEETIVEGETAEAKARPDSKNGSIARRLSTGSLNVRSSLETQRSEVAASEGLAATRPPTASSLTEDAQDENRPTTTSRSRRRGRRGHRSRPSSLKSRSSSIGSCDEEERMRRRELIRAARPGGTGMVTLPDGTKIRARRVGEELEQDVEAEDSIPLDQWGFAGLAREARRSVARSEEGDKAAAEADNSHVTSESVQTAPSSPVASESASKEHEARANDTSTGAAISAPLAAETSTRSADADVSADTTAQPTSISANSLSSSETALRNLSEVMRSPESTRRSRALVDGGFGNTPITLSAEKMAEVRRRHEEEVAALGAEVLASIKQGRKEKAERERAERDRASREMLGRDVAEQAAAVAVTAASINAAHARESSAGTVVGGVATHAGSQGRAHGKSAPRSTSPTAVAALHADAATNSQTDVIAAAAPPQHAPTNRLSSIRKAVRKPSLPRPLRKASKSSDATLSPPGSRLVSGHSQIASGTDGKGAAVSHPLSLTSTPVESGPPASPAIVVSDIIPGDDSGSHRPPAPESTASSSQPYLPLGAALRRTQSPESTRTGRSTSLASRSQTRLAHGSESRLTLDPSISVPKPSPYLPRRPDVRGYSVVPLPSGDLGMRPEKPREGRFWDKWDDPELQAESSEDDIGVPSASASAVSLPATRGRRRNAGSSAIGRGADDEDEDEDEDDEDDPEMVAKEERRLAAQSKRATTRAAGQEIISSASKMRKASSGQLLAQMHGAAAAAAAFEDLSSSRDTEPRRPRGAAEAESSRLRGGRSNRTLRGGRFAPPSLAPAEISSAGKTPALRLSSSTGALGGAGGGGGGTRRRGATTSTVPGRRGRSGARNGGGAAGSDSSSDDAELWPPSLAQSFNKNMAASERLANAASEHSLKARAMRERRAKEQREREREKEEKLKANDEHLDYGWPNSLRGSIY